VAAEHAGQALKHLEMAYKGTEKTQ
jgi:hypothetical protein